MDTTGFAGRLGSAWQSDLLVGPDMPERHDDMVRVQLSSLVNVAHLKLGFTVQSRPLYMKDKLRRLGVTRALVGRASGSAFLDVNS